MSILDTKAHHYSFDDMLAAMCIIEEIVAPLGAGQPWLAYRDNVGINQLRDDIITSGLIAAAQADWDQTYQLYEAGELEDPGAFDYEFIPFWLRNAVKWDASEGPQLRGTRHERMTTMYDR